MRKALSLCLALLVMAVAAGCGSSPTKESNNPSKMPETPAPAPEKKTLTVKVGSTEKAALKNLPMFLTGFSEQEHLKVEYQEYKGGSEVAKALLNGEIDLAFIAVSNVTKDKSGELRLLSMVTNGPGQALLVDSQFKDSIKSVKDLVGKKVGVSSLGSGPDKTLRDLLMANGIDPKNVQILPVGLDASEVLGTGKVAAMITIEPFITIAEQSGKGTVLVDARKPDGIEAIYKTREVPWIALASRTDYIKNNADAVQRMVTMVTKSLTFITISSGAQIDAKSPDFFKEEVKGDHALFTKMVEQNKATFSKDGSFNRSAMEADWQRQQASGAVPKDQAFPFENLVNTQFLDKALASN